ncbi:MAG: EAL domain-containing protein [Gammaproteobacteria bacterium]|nr:EAL domain-containing protein [Gammaproteobacteria bacterium]
MKKNTPTHQSEILPVVLIGFILILLAIGISWLVSNRLLTDISEQVLRSRDIAAKMDIVASMSEIARTRSRLTMEMVYTDDIFDRDEIGMQLNSKATEFSILRQRLNELGLDLEEEAVLSSQRAFIEDALTDQRRAATLALSMEDHDREIAAEIVIQDVYPKQSVIIDHFMQLLEMQKSQLDQIAVGTQDKIRINQRVELILILLLLGLSVAIILFMLRSIKRIEGQLVIEKEKAQVTLGSIGDGVITVNKNGQIIYSNQAAEAITGKSSKSLLNMPILELFERRAYDESQSLWQILEDMLSGRHIAENFSGIRAKFRHQPSQVLKVSIAPIIDQNQTISGVVISFHDITDSQALMERIQFQATHDALTGLYNRRAFEEKVIQMLNLFNFDSNHSFCVIDLDQFKIVNDSAGHAAGDQMLRQIAEVMKPMIRRSDLLSRLGGDEFGLFLPNVSPNEAINIAEKLLKAIQGFGFYWDKNIFRVGASIGIVNITSDINDYDYLYRAADSACYVAKSQGRNQIYLLPMDAEMLEKKSHESELLQYLGMVLEKGEFHLYAQEIKPISDRVKEHKHAEVLIRMIDEQGEIIPPMAFIPIAERYGLMAKIDRWVLQQVCEYILANHDNTLYAVNLSGESLSSRDVMRDMLDLVTHLKIPKGRLCLEVTETVAIANLESASHFMAALREQGCLIALDDFGSGLSSFSYLKTLPLDYLKIDGVFISALNEDPSASIMIEAIHSVGSKLGLYTIAEYVEDKETLEELKKIGIDMAQGFYFDRPRELIKPVI